MKVKDLGESGVIKLLTEMVTRQRQGTDNAACHNFELTVDAGDDAAAWRSGKGTELFTTDTAVEGVHFTRATTDFEDVGWKIMAANVSDVAAMGGLPLYALITVGMPPDTEIDDLKSLYRGIIGLGNQYGVAIVGGDVVRCPTVFVTVGLTGFCQGDPMLRSTSRHGELIAVTGYMGNSAGGLEILGKSLPIYGEAADYLRAAHKRPRPCVSQGLSLHRKGVRTAMDISDGLVEDLSKLCRASGVAARLASVNIPIHPSLKEVFPQGYMDLALSGGEDYQLLFTAPPDLMHQALPSLPPTPAVIGEVIEGEAGQVTVVDSDTGERMVVTHGGWDHFRPAPGQTEG